MLVRPQQCIVKTTTTYVSVGLYTRVVYRSYPRFLSSQDDSPQWTIYTMVVFSLLWSTKQGQAAGNVEVRSSSLALTSVEDFVDEKQQTTVEVEGRKLRCLLFPVPLHVLRVHPKLPNFRRFPWCTTVQLRRSLVFPMDEKSLSFPTTSRTQRSSPAPFAPPRSTFSCRLSRRYVAQRVPGHQATYM